MWLRTILVARAHVCVKKPAGRLAWNPRIDDDGSFWSRNIGYLKLGTKWAIALRRYSGHHNYPDDGPDEEWLFNDGPRHMRIEAVEYIPEMIDKLIADAEKTVEKLKNKTNEVSQLAAVITPPVQQSAPRRK
jgi:hypothetical protein